MKLFNLEKLSQNPNFKKILDLKTIGDKILENRYFTYFVAVITLVIISETFRNPDQKILIFLKNIFNMTAIKLLVILLGLYVGVYNQVLGILILLNLFFITNVRERIEFFVNNLPDLVDKNKALQYEKKFKSPTGERKPEKKIPKTESIEKDSLKQEESQIEENPNSIKNPIKIKETAELTGESIDDSYEKNVEEEAEKVTKKIDNEEIDTSDFDTDIDDSLKDKKKKAIYLKYYKKHGKNKKKHLDDKDFAERDNPDVANKKSLEEHEDRKERKSIYKEELVKELKEMERDTLQEKQRKKTEDKTLETELKQSNYEKRRNLQILEDDDEESSSSESSDSSSSESSSESDREYEDVSLTEAREHVLKKLRNKMKKDYANNN